MPTIYKFLAFRVVIYPDDHRPAHVHVFAAGNEAVYILNCVDGPVDLRENFGFTKKQLKQIDDELNKALCKLCDIWGEIHG